MTKTDLRAGTTPWEADAVAPRGKTLRADQKTDVLIVGAGMSGALLAEQLTADGREVMLLDRRPPGGGSTAASTALLLYEIDTPLTLLSQKLEPSIAARAWCRSRDAMLRLTEKVRALKLRCDYRERDAVLLPGNVLPPPSLRLEVEARAALGLPSKLMKREALIDEFGIDRPCAIRSGASAEANPVKLARALLAVAEKRGAQLFAPEEAAAVESGETGAVVTTKSGHRIEAEYFIWCGGYELPDFIPAKHHEIVSTWAAATKPQPKNLWASRAMLWEASEPYLYVRTTTDGRVIVGGEDEPHNNERRREQGIDFKMSRFRSKLKHLLPQIEFEPEFAWSGAFGSSKTGLPTIGNVPDMPRVCAVLGFGGNGTTYAQIASEMIGNALAGRPEPDIDLFAFAADN